jgi:hypothetical protein
MNYSNKQRTNEINDLVDNTINNNIDKIITKYFHELKDYNYIEKIEEFSLLNLKGSIKYINKFDGLLRSGGLLIKIYKKNNMWYALIKQLSGKKYNISFKSNHIFYNENKTHTLRNWMECFISEVEAGKYLIEN